MNKDRKWTGDQGLPIALISSIHMMPSAHLPCILPGYGMVFLLPGVRAFS